PWRSSTSRTPGSFSANMVFSIRGSVPAGLPAQSVVSDAGTHRLCCGLRQCRSSKIQGCRDDKRSIVWLVGLSQFRRQIHGIPDG
ncbi:MAG: hypothetical protein WBB79_06355, partial [Candidatus Macondimonas sp.]